MEYEPVIGLEVHVQLLTNSKLFCGCSTAFGAPPNTNVCPVCLGLPGALPVLNKEAVAMAIKAALTLNCKINRHSIFARKNYFYPDLPKGYQISMYEEPLAQHGVVEVFTGERSEAGNIINRHNKTFRIHRVHMEEDAGKLIHEQNGGRDGKSFVDFNRSGVPLIETVSEADFRSSQEAYDYLAQLRRTLMYIGVCDGNMEEGSMRCDANVSVRPKGSPTFGTKIEIKNLNSLRFVQKALDYEIKRQIDVLSKGGSLRQETRLWDEERDSTFVMRTKEEAHDYRYFPEPDLLPLAVSGRWIEELKAELPELPEPRRRRFVSEYQISDEEALLLTASRELADYFETCARVAGNPRMAATWVMVELMGALKESGKDVAECPVPAERLGELIRLINQGTISGKIAKTVFAEMFNTGDAPSAIISRLGLAQISDESKIATIIREVLDANAPQIASYRAGKTKVFGFFVGEVMKRTKGQANPQLLNELLKKELDKN